MNKSKFKKITLSAFAIVLFLFALIYISHAKEYSAYYSPMPGAIILVYLTAFVDVMMASSIITNKLAERVCFYGGIYWFFISVLTLVFEIINGNASQFGSYFLQFVSSMGFNVAIFYISATAED